MNYPGNPSLAEDIRQRILETFDHTSKVASQGNLEEAQLGCDFILRLDPLFSPAQTLAARLQSASGPVSVDDLRAGEGDTPSPATPAAPTPAAPAPTPAPAAPPEPEASQLQETLGQLLQARDFRRLMSLAQERREEIAADPGLQQLMAVAQERAEAAPYVDSFLEQARAGLEAGHPEEVRALLDKARSLDGSHPEIIALEQAANAAEGVTGAETVALSAAEVRDALAASAAEAAAVAAPGSEESPGEALALEDVDAVAEASGESSAEGAPGKLEVEEPPGAELSFEDVSLEDELPGDETDTLPELEGGAGDDASEADSVLEAGDDELDFAAVPAGEDELAPEDEPALQGEAPVLEDEAPALEDEAPAPEGEAPGEEELLEGGLELDELGDLELESDALELEELPALGEASAASSGPSDPDPRIAELLDEGQAAYQQGELQTAIDAWSRIFLIDIDHQEAARRIETARTRRAEKDRQSEEALHEGLSQVAAGDLEAARASFGKILELQPGHPQATEYLQKLESGDTAALPSAEAEAAELDGALDQPELEPPPPETELPEPAERPARPSPRPVPPAPSPAAPDRRRTLGLVGVAVLLLVLGGGWFLWSRSGSLFPNRGEPPIAQAPPVNEPTPIQRATQQYRDGKLSMAIAQLKRLPPASPYYEEAQALIGAWETEQAVTKGPSADVLARRAALLDAARMAQEREDYLRALPLYEEASRITPLEGAELAASEEVRAQIAPLQGQLTLLRDGEYDRALRDLWLAREEDPTNPVVNQLLVGSYYNLGVRNLQQGKLTEAKEMLAEAQELAPQDEEVERLMTFAKSYSQQPQDLLYRIYVKYVAARPL